MLTLVLLLPAVLLILVAVLCYSLFRILMWLLKSLGFFGEADSIKEYVITAKIKRKLPLIIEFIDRYLEKNKLEYICYNKALDVLICSNILQGYLCDERNELFKILPLMGKNAYKGSDIRQWVIFNSKASVTPEEVAIALNDSYPKKEKTTSVVKKKTGAKRKKAKTKEEKAKKETTKDLVVKKKKTNKAKKSKVRFEENMDSLDSLDYMLSTLPKTPDKSNPPLYPEYPEYSKSPEFPKFGPSKKRTSTLFGSSYTDKQYQHMDDEVFEEAVDTTLMFGNESNISGFSREDEQEAIADYEDVVEFEGWEPWD